MADAVARSGGTSGTTGGSGSTATSRLAQLYRTALDRYAEHYGMQADPAAA